MKFENIKNVMKFWLVLVPTCM